MDSKWIYLKHILKALSLSIPLIMLNAPTWLIIATILLVFAPFVFASSTFYLVTYNLYHIARPFLYIWAVIVTAQGEQDFIAIAFYIATGIQAYSILKNLFLEIVTLFLMFKD